MTLTFGLIEESGDLILQLAKTWCSFKRVLSIEAIFVNQAKLGLII
jgi:hypothetical protein